MNDSFERPDRFVIVTDRHPMKFRSWNHFMSDLHQKIDIATNKVEFREMGEEEETLIYQYSLDYIKARAYDEFFEAYLKISYDPYEECHAGWVIGEVDKILSYNGRWNGS